MNIESRRPPRSEESSEAAMNVYRATALTAIVLVAACAALADEPQAKLPADGWWARYHVTMKSEQTKEEWTFIRTYALVGTAIENERKCRWVEMKSVPVIDGKEQPDTVVKFLAPERELLES